MNEPIDRSYEANTAAPDYQQQIDAITGRVLTPENIKTYADEALRDLIDVIESIKATYKEPELPLVLSGKGREVAIMRQAGLDPETIEATLDHIADTADDITRIGAIVASIEPGNTVITPPDASDTRIIRGNGLFEQKRMIPRLQAVLLILEKNFGIDVDPETADPAEFRLIRGAVTPEMMRTTPYNLIDLPSLNRMIDVCDEEGNQTFVFDREKILAAEPDINNILHMKKSKLKEYVENTPGLGRQVRYSASFVQDISHLLVGKLNDASLPVTDEAAKFLKPRTNIKSDRLTTTDIADSLEIDPSIVGDWLKANEKEFIWEKPDSKARNSVPTYDPGVLEDMKHDMRILRLASIKMAPEDVVSLGQWPKSVGISYPLAERTIETYHMPIGEFRFGARKKIGRGLFPHDINFVTQVLAENGHFSGPPQKDELNLLEIAERTGITYSTINNYAKKAETTNPSFGKLVWRKRQRPAKYANAHQIAIIEAMIEENKDNLRHR